VIILNKKYRRGT
jgi:hypothetical protein